MFSKWPSKLSSCLTQTLIHSTANRERPTKLTSRQCRVSYASKCIMLALVHFQNNALALLHLCSYEWKFQWRFHISRHAECHMAWHSTQQFKITLCYPILRNQFLRQTKHHCTMNKSSKGWLECGESLETQMKGYEKGWEEIQICARSVSFNRN